MTPGFHIIVYAAVGTGNTKEIVAGNNVENANGRSYDRRIFNYNNDIVVVGYVEWFYKVEANTFSFKMLFDVFEVL
jgi:hypothetical protein